MRISTDVLQTLDANGIDVSSAWLWVDNDIYDSSYRQVLDQPVSLEAITLDFCRWKVSTITLTIRMSDSATSDVLFAGQADLIDDTQGSAQPNHNDLQAIYGEYPYYHLAEATHTLVNAIGALPGAGLLNLTSGTPSLIAIGAANGVCGLGSDSRVAWANLPPSLSGAVHYAGTWNAATNTPTLPDPATNNGAYYIVSVAGSYSGIIFAVGDACISNGTDYEKIDNSQLVTSVFGRVGSVVAAATDYSSFYPRLDNTYANPSWIGSLAWSKITGTPTTLASYGITSADTLFDGKYLNSGSNAATASKLATARTIALSGDGTWSVSFDGSVNVSGALTLASLLTAGNAGSATTVPTLTWDAKGRLTAAGSAAIFIPHTQISDWDTATSSFLTGNQSITLSGVVTGSGTTSITTSFANTHLASINQDLTTTSSPTFLGVLTSNIGSAYGQCGILTGNADNATYSAYNLKIKSWWGIGFESYDNITRILFDTRTGNISTLGSISEGGTALSSKYLGINASIPHTQISDWGTYINQPLLTTSSPTFVSISLGRGSVSNYVGSPSYGAVYGASVTPSSTNYSIAWNVNGADCEINGTASSSLSVNNANIATATSSGLSVVGAISEGGTALSAKYLGINASIPSSRISDWGTYINQPLLTTSSPTFATVTLSGANALNLTSNGSGPYMRSALYQDASGVYLERGLASESGSASPLPFYISKRGGGTPYPFIVNADNVTTNTMLYANGGITGSLTGTASNASALGGVAADNFVQGNGGATWGTRTTNLSGSTALTQGLKSGFYDCDGTNGAGTPTGGWCHMIVNAHIGSNASNQYQWELASGFWNGEIYSRTISPGAVGSWKTLIHSDNYPSFNNFTSGLSTTTLTASGITMNGGINFGTNDVYDVGSVSSMARYIYSEGYYQNGTDINLIYGKIAGANIWTNTNTFNALAKFNGIISAATGYTHGSSLASGSISLNSAQTDIVVITGTSPVVTLGTDAIGRSFTVMNTVSTLWTVSIPSGITLYANGGVYIGPTSAQIGQGYRVYTLTHAINAIWSMQ